MCWKLHFIAWWVIIFLLIYLFLIAGSSDAAQHREKHVYNTYYYESLKQNTMPPLKKRWLLKMSLDNTAWISILSDLHREHQKEYTNLRTTASNDRTLLYTNSLDALHHLGSRNNYLKASCSDLGLMSQKLTMVVQDHSSGIFISLS